jgi:hypothetical protein
LIAVVRPAVVGVAAANHVQYTPTAQLASVTPFRSDVDQKRQLNPVPMVCKTAMRQTLTAEDCNASVWEKNARQTQRVHQMLIVLVVYATEGVPLFL